jgi:hypothetical protein
MLAGGRACAILAAIACIPLAAHSGDRLSLEGMIDVRAVYADGATSFLDGGLGRLRFDDNHDGLRLARAFVAASFRIDDLLTLHAVGGSFGDHNKTPVDLSEFWLEARPYPSGPIRYRFRLGAFHMPVSLENRAAGWTSPYSLSSSAINTWVGEELRSIGAEGEARWSGATVNYYGDIGAVFGVYGWNDPAGALIAQRGWALHDRQSTLFDTYGRPGIAFYREIDRRPGYYAGLSWRHQERLEIRALRYDNRGDPGASNSSGSAWRTQFTSVGLRWEPDLHWTVIAQKLQGQTYVGSDLTPEDQFAMSMRAWFVLTSFQLNAERITLRYDDFGTLQRRGFYGSPSDDSGHAITLAFMHDFDEHWQFVGEWQKVFSRFPPRLDLGLPESIIETQAQLAIRYRFEAKR